MINPKGFRPLVLDNILMRSKKTVRKIEKLWSITDTNC